MTLNTFFLSQHYQKISELGDRVGEIEKLIDWEKFRP